VLLVGNFFIIGFIFVLNQTLWLNCKVVNDGKFFLAQKLKRNCPLRIPILPLKLADLMQNIPNFWHKQEGCFGCEVPKINGRSVFY
jgi:hypothetical protein